MTRLANAEQLNELREKLGAAVKPDMTYISICSGTGCLACGCRPVVNQFKKLLAERGLEEKYQLKTTGCHGFCERGPVVVIQPQGIFYQQMKPEDVEEVIEKTLEKGEIVRRLLYRHPQTGEEIVREEDVPFYKHQQRIVFADNGRLDPRDIEDYIRLGGYQAMAKALFEMTPDEVIESVKQSGLRGRGGGGFPTGLKWESCRKSPGNDKFIVCNADEGDPGAYMDRSVLEGNPHSVLEGMIIGCYATGANEAYVYVRDEYPLAVENLTFAIEEAKKRGLLGHNILGSDHTFNVKISRGGGAFVCGEETALISSLEGRIGEPRPRPPYPSVTGLWGKPTNVNNVETWANVPNIIRKGPDWFAGIGTKNSKGTKIFSLVGKINNTGLVEVPMGTPLRDIVFDIGGGIQNNRDFKAVQTGGPSGGCIPAALLDLPVDFDKLTQSGAMMGSGGLIVMDERTCMVDLAKYFLTFLMDESCGKCTPCREGLFQMHSILSRICDGQGVEEDIELLENFAEYIKDSSLCQLGGTAPNSVLSTLKYFRDEYVEHIREKHCRAAVCEELVEAPCSHSCPAGINAAQYVGLIAEGRPGDAVEMIRRRNPFVSVCGRVCDAPCEKRCRRSDVDEPIAIRALKRYAHDNADMGMTAPLAPVTGEREVAIIGAGPAGLSCAYFLARMGRRSTVFEALPVAGGLLVTGIPEYRLPRASLQADIDFILSHGVELRTNTRIDSIDQLRAEGYKAIFVATGAPVDRKLGIEGEELDGVEESLVFLRNRALGQPVKCGKHVAVIGGGNAAVDTARSALRLDAEKVTILYRRTRAEMPAYEEEIEAALAEGVEIVELVAPVRVHGKDGKVTGIEMIRSKLGATDRSGRRRPVPIEGSEFVVECDTVIPAVGQAPTTELTGGTVDVASWGGVKIDVLTGATSAPDVFAGGDCVSGGATVVEAIAQGQKAAVAIDRVLGGAGMLPDNAGPSTKKPTEEELEQTLDRPRVAEPELPVDDRVHSFDEVLCGLTPGAACGEAARCLRCDLERAEARKKELSGVGAA